MVEKSRKRNSTSYITIKSPRSDSQRVSFAICEKRLDGRWHTLEVPELDKINSLFKAGVLDIDEAEKQVRQLRENLYKERDKDKYVWKSDNEKLFHIFWEDRYLHRPILSIESAKNDYKRVLNHLGEEISLLTSSRDVIQEFVNTLYPDCPNKLRALVANLNTLLKYANRDFRIFSPKREHLRIKHITLSDLHKILPKINIASKILPPELSTQAFRLFVQTGFFTGARTGEILAIREEDIHDSWIYIREQLDRKLRTRRTKTNRKRKTVLIPEGVDVVREFAALPEDVKNWLRLAKNSEKLQLACIDAGLGVNKQIKFHGLRASYCLHLLNKGIPPNIIADSIGDRISTFEQHYKDYIIEEARILDTFNKLK